MLPRQYIKRSRLIFEDGSLKISKGMRRIPVCMFRIRPSVLEGPSRRLRRVGNYNDVAALLNIATEGVEPCESKTTVTGEGTR